MNLKQMEYFRAIVNEGNISAAAKSLHISQPPLSAQMKLLEDELGVVLFERGSRSIFLTEAGKVFYEKALHILHLTTAVSDELQQMGQGLRGPLHMGMISSVQTPKLIRALSSFVSLHPEVTLRISEGNTYELMDQINSGLIEVAVVRTPLPTESYQCHFLEAEPMMAVGKPEFFPDPAAASISVASLASCPLIVYRRWEPFISHCFPGTAPDYLCINDDARTSMTWAQCGAGIALVPSSMARSGGEDLLKIPLSDQGVISQIALIARKHGMVSRVSKEFFHFFPEYFANKGFKV